jgi:hypothetical protein
MRRLVNAVIVLLFLTAPICYAEKVQIERAELEKIKAHIIELQALADSLNAALDEKTLELETIKTELEATKRATRGVWVGAGTGIPWPAISGMISWQIADRIMLWTSGGINKSAYINLGFTARITK